MAKSTKGAKDTKDTFAGSAADPPGRRLPRRFVMSCVGVLLTAASIAMFTKSSFGTDPFTTFVLGVTDVTGLRYGMVYTAVNLVIIVVVAVAARRNIGLATPVTIFLSGFVTEGCMILLDLWLEEPGLAVRIALITGGIVLQCFATALYYTGDLGVSAYDACALGLHQRMGLPFRFCRIGTDLLCVSVGFAFGAVVGVGTMITAFCMGPLVDRFNRTVAVPLLNAAFWDCIGSRILQRA